MNAYIVLLLYKGLKDESNLFLFMHCDEIIDELKIYEAQSVYIHLSVVGCLSPLHFQFTTIKTSATDTQKALYGSL